MTTASDATLLFTWPNGVSLWATAGVPDDDSVGQSKDFAFDDDGNLYTKTEGWVVIASAGEPADLDLPATHVAPIASANAVNPANVAYTQADQTALAALANSLKTQFNALLTSLQDAGLVASS